MPQRFLVELVFSMLYFGMISLEDIKTIILTPGQLGLCEIHASKCSLGGRSHVRRTASDRAITFLAEKGKMPLLTVGPMGGHNCMANQCFHKGS